MAKILEQNIVIRFSKIVKDSKKSDENVVDEELLASLEQVVQEIVGDSVVVEVIEE